MGCDELVTGKEGMVHATRPRYDGGWHMSHGAGSVHGAAGWTAAPTSDPGLRALIYEQGLSAKDRRLG